MRGRTILQELQGQFPFAETHLDLSLLKLQPDAEEEIENIFDELAFSLKDSEMCVANNGLCLLIALLKNRFKEKSENLKQKKSTKKPESPFTFN